MLKFKFGAWAVVLMLTAFSFSACDDNDDETYNPPANITEALEATISECPECGVGR